MGAWIQGASLVRGEGICPLGSTKGHCLVNVKEASAPALGQRVRAWTSKGLSVVVTVTVVAAAATATSAVIH